MRILMGIFIIACLLLQKRSNIVFYHIISTTPSLTLDVKQKSLNINDIERRLSCIHPPMTLGRNSPGLLSFFLFTAPKAGSAAIIWSMPDFERRPALLHQDFAQTTESAGG